MRRSPKDCHPNNRWLKFFKKWHRWPGVVMAMFFIFWALSGIVMNHRELVSGLDINRNYLPSEYQYTNWNNAAVKSAVDIGKDSLLIYGNIGIWLSDSTLSHYSDFNCGFPDGIDNRKISSMLYSIQGNLYAGTLFGLYYFDFEKHHWQKIDIPAFDNRIQWLEEKGKDILVLTRSKLFLLKDDVSNFQLKEIHLPAPQGYENKAGLFRTIWVIHSGEIYGTAGKLVVDLLGLVVIFLVLTGMLHFSMPYALRRLKKRKKSLSLVSSTKKLSFKWHKKAGIWIFIFILVNTITGMFLRPPLLIAIANARVSKIPWSVLDTPNPWEDKLRAIIYDEDLKGYMIGTSDGIYFATEDLNQVMFPPAGQPPLSVMGINVFQKAGPGKYLVGTFNGLYDWYPIEGYSRNHITGKQPEIIDAARKPFGDQMAAGYIITRQGMEVYYDYNSGARILGDSKPLSGMTGAILEESPMSWWNLALEVHTGRIFQFLVGDFYILFIPLMGIFGTILVISGLVVWVKLFLRKRKKSIN